MAERKRKVVSCAACRVQRKKCSEECILAPHFPADDPNKFAVVHRVYGTSNIIKLLQGLETQQGEDAIKILVCEASARLEDPIKGNVKVVHELEKQIVDLELQLEAKKEELKNMCSDYENLVHFLNNGFPIDPTEDIMYEEVDPLLWEPILG